MDEIWLTPAQLVPGRADDPTWTTVRCLECGAEGQLPTAAIPLVEDLEPVRDDDGTRMGWCSDCVRKDRVGGE